MTKKQSWPTGLRISSVRWMTRKELDNEGWSRPTTVLVLEDGSKVYASRDDEGNDSGALFGVDASDGSTVRVLPSQRLTPKSRG